MQAVKNGIFLTIDQNNTTDPTLESKKSFLIDSFKLGFGTAAGQIILILSMPVLSRIFTPADFGVATLFLSIVIIASRISGLRYEVAIMLPAREYAAKLMFLLYTVISLVFSTIVGTGFWIFRETISGWLNSPRLAFYFILIGPAIFLFGMVNGTNYWNTRKKQYNRLAAGRLSNNGGSTLFQLLFGFLGYTTPSILILGLILGKTIEWIIIGYRESLYILKSLPHRIRIKTMALARKYRKFPQYNTWAVLINNLSWYVPGFILAGFFSTKVVGWYAIGERTVRAPMNFIGHAISQVFFQRGSEASRNRKLDALFTDTVGMLIRMGTMPTIVILILGRDIFSLMLGADWAEAGVYVQLLSVWALIWFITSPITPIISITNNLEKGLIFDSVSLTLRIISLLVGGLLHSPRIAIMLFGITGIISYGGLLLWVGSFAGVSVTQTLKLFLHKNQIWVPITIAILLVLKYFQIKSFLIILIAGVILFIYFTLILEKNKRIYGPKKNQ